MRSPGKMAALNAILMATALSTMVGGMPTYSPGTAGKELETNPAMKKWGCKVPKARMKKVRNFRVPLKG